MNSSSQAGGSAPRRGDIYDFPALKRQIGDAMAEATADGMDKGTTLLYILERTTVGRSAEHEPAKQAAWAYCKELSESRPAKITRAAALKCSASLQSSCPVEADGSFLQDDSDEKEGMLARIRSAPAGHVA